MAKDYRLAIVMDRAGRVVQTAVFAEDAADRIEGHRLLQWIEPDVAVFAERVRQVVERERRGH